MFSKKNGKDMGIYTSTDGGFRIGNFTFENLLRTIADITVP